MKLAASNVSLTLGKHRALDSVNFEAQPGELTGLIGPNGSGKSSLLRILAGITSCFEGGVFLGDTPLGDFRQAILSQMLAYLPQSRELNWNLTVEELVALGRLPHPIPSDLAHEKETKKALEELNISHLAGRQAKQLSGGERARVLAARIVAQATPVLIADEPSSGLDPAQELFLFELLKRFSQEGKTVIVAVHNLSLAARFCDSLNLLHDGRNIVRGTPQHVLSADNIARAYGILTLYTETFGIPQIIPVERAGAHPATFRKPAA